MILTHNLPYGVEIEISVVESVGNVDESSSYWKVVLVESAKSDGGKSNGRGILWGDIAARN